MIAMADDLFKLRKRLHVNRLQIEAIVAGKNLDDLKNLSAADYRRVTALSEKLVREWGQAAEAMMDTNQRPVGGLLLIEHFDLLQQISDIENGAANG
jgi:hypothetical protein